MIALSKEEYRILVEQAPIMIWRSDTTKACNYFNQVWLDFTGRTMDQELGNGWAEGVHENDFDRCLEIYTTAFDNREEFEMEYRLRRHDGEYRWIFDRGVPYYEDMQFQGYIGSCIDIHKAKMAEQELKRIQENRIKRLEELIPVCAWCRKIRKGKDYFADVESYIKEIVGSEITHIICTECSEELLRGNGLSPV